MHHLLCADDRVNWTSGAAMRAADTVRFIDNGNRAPRRGLLGQRLYISAQQCGKAAYRIGAAGRAEINRSVFFDNSRRVRAAARITALCALSLRQ
jgi:hypothetical protein